MWINAFEFLFALPLVLAVIPVQGISIDNIPSNVENGYKCLLTGNNSDTGDQCPYVGFWYLTFIIFLVADKVNQALILKYNSSNLMWLASTFGIPLSSIAFSLEFIMGKEATHISGYLIAGIAVVFIGLVVYRSTKEVTKSKELDLLINSPEDRVDLVSPYK